MKLQHRLSVPASQERVWAQFEDLPGLGSCVPGVESMTPTGEDRYRGRFKVAMGPIRLALEGDLEVVSRDEAAGRVALRASGSDSRLGGAVRVLLDLSLVAGADGGTDIVIDSDVAVMGRIGEFGQPIMKRKADEVMRSFSTCLAARLA